MSPDTGIADHSFLGAHTLLQDMAVRDVEAFRQERGKGKGVPR
jgi:hypothetical protein